jgi:hypothetical protein
VNLGGPRMVATLNRELDCASRKVRHHLRADSSGAVHVHMTRTELARKPACFLLLVDFSVFHHEGNFFECADILKGIAGNGNHVGKFSRLDRTDDVGVAQ